MMVFEQFKTMPWTLVWDEYCRRQGVPTDDGVWSVVKDYEERVLINRD